MNTDGGQGETGRDFHAVLDDLARVQAERAQLDARESELYAECAEYALARIEGAAPNSSDSEIMWRSTAMEVGAALRITDRTAGRRMDTARTLRCDLPDVWAAWSRGEITREHVTAIMREAAPISDPEARAAFAERILVIAGEEAPGRTATIARVMASRIEPAVITERISRAVADRHVAISDVEDGMSLVTAMLPTTLARGIFDRLTQAAKLVKQAERRAQRAHDDTHGDDVVRPGVRRTDEIRADLFADLLLTGAPSSAQLPNGTPDLGLGALRGHVQIVVTAEALYGDSDDPAIITGGGAISLDHARHIAAQTPTWDRLTIDPTLNTLLSVEAYRPSEAQRRLLTALDEHCRQPGCQRPATHRDIDHSLDFALGGLTHIVNLAHVCEPHHVIKHADGWTITRTPDGALIWTSRHGRSYPDKPRPAVAFMFSPAATHAPF